jgi:hypothetical protein
MLPKTYKTYKTVTGLWPIHYCKQRLIPVHSVHIGGIKPSLTPKLEGETMDKSFVTIYVWFNLYRPCKIISFGVVPNGTVHFKQSLFSLIS